MPIALADGVANQQSDLPNAIPSNFPRATIEGFAESITRDFDLLNFNDDDTDPLHRFVATIGGEIQYQNPSDFIASESGSIKVYAPNKFQIFLSTFTGPLRDRFTVAHELGHYFIHSMQGEKPLRASRKGSGQLEWEANWFAAALLMPEQEFRNAMNAYGPDPYALAGIFRVSTQAVEVRLKRIPQGNNT